MSFDKYTSKKELQDEIEKRKTLFINELEPISADEMNLSIEEVDKTPYQMLAYQIGWLDLLLSWEENEKLGLVNPMPMKDFGWNQHKEIHESFYRQYDGATKEELTLLFEDKITLVKSWLEELDEEMLFSQGFRQWTGDNPKWPIARWIHINTVAPFKSFRTRIRKYKKLRKK